MQAWGGPGAGYDWGDMEHSLSVDHRDNVWITFHNPLERSWSAPVERTDDMILKFTSKGKFIRQFGGRDRHPLGVGASTDTTSVHLATEAVVFPKTNEVFIADGYGNRRVLVLDAETLAFKRMWGAFGKQPPPTLGRGVNRIEHRDDDRSPRSRALQHRARRQTLARWTRLRRRPEQPARSGVHPRWEICRPGVREPHREGLQDRERNRVFSRSAAAVHLRGRLRERAACISWTGRRSSRSDRSASKGEKRGEFLGLHTIAVDSKGNLWTAETQPKPVGSRVQRLIFKGIS